MLKQMQWPLAGLLALGLVSAGLAEEPVAVKPEVPGKLTLATERVVIFKDGFALFVKNAAGAADKDGRVFTDEVPDGAVLGCFWATSEQHKAIAMRAEWDEVREERATETPCITTLELLRANKGKKVTLGLTREKAPDLTGTISEVLELPPEKEKKPVAGALERAAWMSARAMPASEDAGAVPGAEGETVRELTPRGGQLVAVDTDQGRVVLPVAEVRTVAGAELITKMQRKEEAVKRTKRLSFELGADAANQKAAIKILYFAEGVRWIPTYRISGEMVDKADLALQGEIVNEAEDIAGAAVDLVVGVPNFRFKTTISPLSLEKTLRQALVAANPNLMRNDYSNGQFSQRAGEWGGRAREAAGGEGVMNLAPELAATGQQDLYVYSAKSMTLKKGARATTPLWQSSAPLRHLYTMDVKVNRDARSGSAYQHDPDQPSVPSPLKLAQQQVWHQIELGNNGKAPWTTGAALIMKDNLPLGQELMTYTSPGAAALVPVTVAVDMCGSYSEEELSRQPNAMNWNGTNYTLIHKKATVTIDNKRKEKSLTRVSVSLGGKAEKANEGGKVKLDDFRLLDWQNTGYYGANNHSDVSWEFELEPGQTKTLTFEITLYVY
ncbi:MAG: hypothetical protein HY291_19860 [Planctomycetes bacterium]|nr:hypothetical protein [Planctomycetota bacterium]